MFEQENLKDKQLSEVSGGTIAEYRELKAFINKHDPDYRIYNEFDIIHWIGERGGIPLKSAEMNDNWDYSFVLQENNKTVGAAELLNMLKERFPD